MERHPGICHTTDTEVLANDPYPDINYQSREFGVQGMHGIGGIIKATLLLVVVNLMLYEPCEKPKLSVAYGNANHEFDKSRGQLLSKYFQETFVCKVDEGIEFLEVCLWDSHRFTSDKLVGSAKVQLHNVTSEKFHPFTTQLFSDRGRLVGEVQLKIRLVEAWMLESVPLLPSAGHTSPRALPDGLSDHRGTEIPSSHIRARIGDLYEFNLESCNTPLKEIDPYVSMKYGDVVYKTKKSRDGVVLMDFGDRFVCKADEAIKVLDVDLWKRHRIMPDELVGSAKIELDCVTSGAFHHTTTQLFSKDGRYVGEVGLKIRRVKPSDVNHPLKTYKRGNFHNCTKQ